MFNGKKSAGIVLIPYISLFIFMQYLYINL